MKEYQLRVIEEQKELNDKFHKLSSFLNSDKILDTTPEEQHRLIRQMVFMEAYSNVLSERIKAF